MIHIENMKELIKKDLFPDFKDIALMCEKNWKRYRETAIFFIQKVSPNPAQTILDYGCGFPIFSKILVELGYKVFSYEPYASERHLQLAKALGMEQIYQKSIPEGMTFDYVVMVDVIEHLNPIRTTMLDVWSKTNTNGWLVISTPNVLRLDLWLKFVTRKTGHPTKLLTFLDAEDSYTGHQREFTLDELITTLDYFGFKTKHFDIVNTKPEWEKLRQYHLVKGVRQGYSKPSTFGKAKRYSIDVVTNLFPKSLGNNLFVASQKYNK